MEIIVHGDKEKIMEVLGVKKFTCRYCGCVFLAEKDEYSIIDWRNELIFTSKCIECRRDCFIY